MKVERSILFPLLVALWEVFLVFSVLQWNRFNLLNIIGFLYLTIVPGLIISLGIKAGHTLPFWARLGQIIGLSLLVEIVWLLLCNTMLPHLHVSRPLDRIPLLVELSALNFVIAVWGWRKLKRFSYVIPSKSRSEYLLYGAASFTPFLFVILAVMGAVSLNNGSTNAFTMGMLILACGYLGLLIVLRKRLADSSIAWALYFISLSLLLMTSMRGWYITGHDIQHEYLVFRMTVAHGDWNIANYRDPFNSCLSITILPTMFYNTLHIGSQYVYKILFQLIFAIVPVIIYQMMRLYLSKAKSIMAVIYFISFPTYFTDMSFLNRQEIAFLFLSLMLLFILNKYIPLKKRQWLFIAFGIGVVLSHYSTTYALLILLVCAVVMRLLLNNVFARRFTLKRLFSHSGVAIVRGRRFAPFAITIPMVTILVIAAFAWNVVLTDTASSAVSLIGQITDTLRKGSSTDTRSNDVSYSLIAPKAAKPQQLVNGYLQAVIGPKVKTAPNGTFFPQSVIDKYPIRASPPDNSPLTSLGHLLASKHLNVYELNYGLKQTSAKLVQVLAVLGLCYVIFFDGFGRSIDTDYFALSIGSGFFIALQLVIPFLSEAYGLLRAFQQALMLFGMYLVAGTFVIARIFRKFKFVSMAIPVVIALGFFLSSTGVISELLGGYQAQLHLNNSGTYYDEYYMHAQELAADDWLVSNVIKNDPRASVQTDLDTSIRLDSVTGYQAQNDIIPSQIETYSYVLLGYNDTVNRQAYISFDGNTVPYNYPIQFLNNNKDLLYSNGSSEIYR